MSIITSVEQLEALYGVAQETSTAKEVDYITPHYRSFIEASPFVILGTAGPEGLDASPRGDKPGFVRGNNRVDSLRNIVRDPRVGLLFLIPGSGTTLRVNGRSQLSIDAGLLESFAVEEKAPRSVAVIRIESVYFQCARAIMRSELWNPARHVDPASLPTAGQILAEITAGRVGGEPYDKAWPERAQASMW